MERHETPVRVDHVGIAVESIAGAEPVLFALGCEKLLEASGLRVVDRQRFEDWTEAFVSPRNEAGTLFELMEFHDSYHDDRLPPETLYVGGHRIGRDAGEGVDPGE